jgi:hypothetical protein
VDLKRRAVLWERLLEEAGPVSVRADLACGETGVYASAAGKLYGLSVLTGSRLFEPIADIVTAPLIARSMLIAGARSERIALIDPSNGAIINSIGIGDMPTTRPALLGYDILVGTEGGDMAAFRM